VLVEAGIEEGRILQVFRQIFGSAYDERKTLQMYRRAKAKIEGGEQLRGAGSFIHSLRESGLKDLEHLTHVVAGRIQVEEEWVEPIPFDSYDALPDFPIEALPQAGREMVEATADVNQVDPGLPASIYLACLSVALAKKACVNLASHSEPLNIYTASVLDSGERKSSTMRTMTDPVYEYQAAEQEGKEEEIRKAANAHKIRETRLDRLQKEAAKCDDFSERKRLELDAAEIAREIAENSVPNVPVFILDDVTTESLGIHMSENGERMAIMSTEGGVFSNMTGRYDKKTANFDLYLKAHAGDPLSITRVHRGANTMQSPALTMCLTVQPDVIKEIGQNKQFRGRGLTARFLYSVCKPQAGYRKRQDKAIPGAIIEGYHAHITELANISPGEHILKLSQDAQAFWDEFYNDIELEIRPGGSLENLPDWGSKLPGAVARIAGLLHFAEHEMKALELPVSVDTVKGACVIGAYFKDHALAAFDLMHSDPAIESGKRILKAIVRHSLKQLKPSDVFQYTNLRTLDEITPGLKVLLEREYIREMNQQYSGKGRPRAATYAVNPNIIKGGFQP
jgi:hypothetical protein